MRIKIKFTPNNKPVPFQNYSLLNSYIHDCLGRNNDYHDKNGNYNISALQGGNRIDKTDFLDFKDGSFICVSAMGEDIKIIDELMKGVSNNPNFGFGMKYDGIEFMQDNFINGVNNFLTLSPINLKKPKLKGEETHYWTIKDPEFETVLTERTKIKLLKINPDLNLKNFNITIPIRESNKPKTIMVKNVPNHVSQCPVNINCSKEVAEILYNIGIGQSTNSGFGCIYKAENHLQYRKYKKIDVLQPV